MLSNGRWNVPLAAWLWPFCVLFYLHESERLWEKALPAVLLVAGAVFKWFGVAAGTDLEEVCSGALLGLISCLPFVLEELLYRRVRGFAGTLVLPLGFAGAEFALSFTPFSAIDAIAVTQHTGTSLMQLASLLGPYAVTLLIVWCSTAALYVWEHRTEGWKTALRPAAIYGGILAACLLFGGLRLALAPGETPTVRMAMTTGIDIGDFTEVTIIPPYEDSVRSLETAVTAAARGGAELLVYCEEAHTVYGDRWESFHAAASAAAAENNIDLLLPVELVYPEAKNVNMLVYISHTGETVLEYVKSHLVFGVEVEDYVQGTGGLPNASVALPGEEELRFTAGICMDANFPDFIRQELAADARVLLVPCWDWSPIDLVHSRWIVYRGVENGVTVVTSTYDGYTTVSDPYGRLLVTSQTDTVGYEHLVFGDVPLTRLTTVYGTIGPVVDWLWPAALLALAAFGWIRKKKRA